jgi:hypothetical protein
MQGVYGVGKYEKIFWKILRPNKDMTQPSEIWKIAGDGECLLRRHYIALRQTVAGSHLGFIWHLPEPATKVIFYVENFPWTDRSSSLAIMKDTLNYYSFYYCSAEAAADIKVKKTVGGTTTDLVTYARDITAVGRDTAIFLVDLAEGYLHSVCHIQSFGATISPTEITTLNSIAFIYNWAPHGAGMGVAIVPPIYVGYEV